MDYLQQLEQLKKDFIEVGLTEDVFEKLQSLALEESLDRAMGDIPEEKMNEEEMKALAEREIKTEEDFKILYDAVFTKAYGEEEGKKKSVEFIIEYLKESLEIAKQSKDLAQRYQAGDPTAVATVQANIDNPDVKEIEKIMADESLKAQQ